MFLIRFSILICSLNRYLTFPEFLEEITNFWENWGQFFNLPSPSPPKKRRVQKTCFLVISNNFLSITQSQLPQPTDQPKWVVKISHGFTSIFFPFINFFSYFFLYYRAVQQLNQWTHKIGHISSSLHYFFINRSALESRVVENCHTWKIWKMMILRYFEKNLIFDSFFQHFWLSLASDKAVKNDVSYKYHRLLNFSYFSRFDVRWNTKHFSF